MDWQREPDQLIIRDWIIDDPDILRITLGIEPAEVEPALERALKVGAIALSAVRAPVGVDLVEREFARLADNLRAMFDAGRRDSIPAQMASLLEQHVSGGDSKLTRLLDPSRPDTPLGTLQVAFQERLRLVERALSELQQALQVRMAVEATRARTPLKGADFQQLVHAYVEQLARVTGDVVLDVGDEAGDSRGRKVGDLQVTLNPADTGGAEVRLAVEVKDRALKLRRILDELGEAKANRRASAAIAVFGKAEQMPEECAPFRDYPGHRFVCLLDKDQPDPTALTAVYRLARTMAIVHTRARADLDHRAIEEAASEVRASCDLLARVQALIGQSRSASDAAGRELEVVREQILRDLERLERLCRPTQLPAETVA